MCKVKGCNRPDGFGAKTGYFCFKHWEKLPRFVRYNCIDYYLKSSAVQLKNELEYGLDLLNRENS